jgi:hypothetical protein
MPNFAERALAKHREKVQDILFEKPIPESDSVSREITSRVLGMSVDFSKPILDVASNPISQYMVCYSSIALVQACISDHSVLADNVCLLRLDG